MNKLINRKGKKKGREKEKKEGRDQGWQVGKRGRKKEGLASVPKNFN